MRTNAHEIWSKRVSRWKESGLTAKEFATELGISANNLQHWKWRLANQAKPRSAGQHEAKPAPRFVEVSVPELHTEATSAKLVAAAATVEPLEVVLSGGLLVRVPVRFDADALRRVVVALEGR